MDQPSPKPLKGIKKIDRQPIRIMTNTALCETLQRLRTKPMKKRFQRKIVEYQNFLMQHQGKRWQAFRQPVTATQAKTGLAQIRASSWIKPQQAPSTQIQNTDSIAAPEQDQFAQQGSDE